MATKQQSKPTKEKKSWKKPPTESSTKNEVKGRTKRARGRKVTPDEDDFDYEPDKLPSETTRDFEEVFLAMCAAENFSFIPPVVGRPKPPALKEDASLDTDSTAPPRSSELHQRYFVKSAKRLRKQVNGKKVVGGRESGEESPLGAARSSSSLGSEEDLDAEPEYRTFSTNSKFACFWPCVQVEKEQTETGDAQAVTELYVRGWRLQLAMLETLQACWANLQNLQTVNLWRVGLTAQGVHLLACCLPHCLGLRHLLLDNNPVDEQNYHELLQTDHLHSLSLRHCRLTNEGGARVAGALGTARTSNKRLLSLDLAGNLLTDEGAACIAWALRTNRSLLTLGLANNRIGDAGAGRLADALSCFAMTREELAERRRLVFQLNEAEEKRLFMMAMLRRASVRKMKSAGSSVVKTPRGNKVSQLGSALKRSDSKQKKVGTPVVTISSSRTPTEKSPRRESGPASPTRRRSTPDRDKLSVPSLSSGRRSRGSIVSEIDVNVVEVDDEQISVSSSVDLESSTGKPRGKRKSRGRDAKSKAPDMEMSPKVGKLKRKMQKTRKSLQTSKELPDQISLTTISSPLLEEATYSKGRLWLPGNRVLISLNVSRNRIGEAGLQALLRAVQCQTTLTQASTVQGQGLMRLCVHKNNVSADSQMLRDIEEVMRVKDPFYTGGACPETSSVSLVPP